MKGAIASEWIKVRNRRMPWILLALLPVVLAVLYTLLFVGFASAEQSADQAAQWEARLSMENVVTFADAMVYRLVALFCVILGGSMRRVKAFSNSTISNMGLLARKISSQSLPWSAATTSARAASSPSATITRITGSPDDTVT